MFAHVGYSIIVVTLFFILKPIIPDYANMNGITRAFLLIALSIWIIAAPAARSYPAVAPESDNDLLPGFCMAPGSLDDYPIKNGETVIDPWSYLQRLGLYKIMLNVTDKYMPLRTRTPTFKNDNWNLDNMLWGLPIQFSWQMQTGRLQDFSDHFPYGTDQQDNDVEISSTSWKMSNVSDLVSPNSWWGSMNYYLSVIPFLGAINSGVISLKHPIKILPPKDHSELFCVSIESCKEFGEALQHWTEFFEGVVTPSGIFASPTLTPRKDNLLDLIWTAHKSSLHMVINWFGEVLPLMPAPEQNLGLSWGNLVDYIAAVR